MNDTPTSGPISSSIVHHARDATSSRHSLASSQKKAARPLCERKEDLFQVGRSAVAVTRRGGGERVERPFAAHDAVAQEHEAIADPRRVADLMNREDECTPQLRMLAN